MTSDLRTAPGPVSLGEALWYGLKLGFISFGGAYAFAEPLLAT